MYGYTKFSEVRSEYSVSFLISVNGNRRLVESSICGLMVNVHRHPLFDFMTRQINLSLQEILHILTGMIMK